MMRRLAVLLLPLSLAACDEQAMQDFRLPWDRPAQTEPVEIDPTQPPQPPAVSPLEVPVEVPGGRTAPVSTAERLTMGTADFAAVGTEPFWNVTVRGTNAVYTTPENQRGRSLTVRRITYARGVEFAADLDGRVFWLNIRPGQCSDGMSDKRYPMTATLRVRGQTLQGCAEPAPPPATGG